MLLFGIRLAIGGASVTFIDRADDIGGAWRTRTLFGASGVEIGVHLIENRRTSNFALLDVIGRDRIIEGSLGFGLIARARIPLSAARVLLYGGLLLKGVAR
jgi:hypothetical protein